MNYGLISIEQVTVQNVHNNSVKLLIFILFCLHSWKGDSVTAEQKELEI